MSYNPYPLSEAERQHVYNLEGKVPRDCPKCLGSGGWTTAMGWEKCSRCHGWGVV